MALQRIEASSKSGQIGVVHLGLGAFHRAHQAVYLERYRQRQRKRSGDGERGRDREMLLARMASVDTRIVTLTVTEKGYFLNPASGELRSDDPMVVGDMASPQEPRTAPGLLVEALAWRREAGIAPFTVLSCDNMPDNGNGERY